MEVRCCEREEPHVLTDLLKSIPKAISMTGGPVSCPLDIVTSTGTPLSQASPDAVDDCEIPDGMTGYQGPPSAHRRVGSKSPFIAQRFFDKENPLLPRFGMTEEEVLHVACSRYTIHRYFHPDGCALQRLALIKSTLNLVKKALRTVPQFLRRGKQ